MVCVCVCVYYVSKINWYRYINKKTPHTRGDNYSNSKSNNFHSPHKKTLTPSICPFLPFPETHPILCHFLLNYFPRTCNSKTSFFNNPTFAFFNVFCVVLPRIHLQRTVVCSHLQRTVLCSQESTCKEYGITN